MSIIFHEGTGQFHLSNDSISYVMGILPNKEMGQLYYGKKVHDREDFSYLLESFYKSMVVGMPLNENFSLEMTRQEYPSFGSTDLRNPAFEITYENGSHVSHFQYVSHEIYQGKRELEGLPATYVEEDGQAESLDIHFRDELTKVELCLTYTIWRDYPVITRSARFCNAGKEKIVLRKAMSLSLDLPDHEYDWIQFSGAWGRERTPIVKELTCGITAIESQRGHSSANQNPFIICKRKNTDEFQGEAIGLSFVYSGNFLAQAEVDTYGTLRLLMGIHPRNFAWPLQNGESFQTPEVVMAWTGNGLNDLSQTYHRMYRKNLTRGMWKEKERPILLNNWEATMMDFTEESILKIAKKGKEAGVELFVLDDGWFGERNDDHRGLGDWKTNLNKLPEGIGGLGRKINDMGLKFGLWFEPEMVNEDSDMYRQHPDWILNVPGRDRSLGRHQMVLDFSKEEVVENIYQQMHAILADAPIAYVKWDMNRTITECFSIGKAPEEQGMVYHKYILGVYSLYERLKKEFPEILFESCASGGARFDAGMLYYAPQAWCSDDTDAIERLKIQYGSSYGYPVSSIGSHVSAVPNQQTGRNVSIDTRANVAYFGTFGYELDLNHISAEEFEEVKKQIEFMKKYRGLIQSGRFYRLSSPFNKNVCSWMVVSEDQSEAIVGYYPIMAEVNSGAHRLRLTGLKEDVQYCIGDKCYWGDELMHIGMITTDQSVEAFCPNKDFESKIFVLKNVNNAQ